MRKAISILLPAMLLFSFPENLPAQNRYTDSLKNELNKGKLPDTTRMALLLDLGAATRYSDAALARTYFKDAYAIASALPDYYAMLTALAGTGHTFYTERKYDSALYYYQLSREAGKKDTTVSAQENEAMVDCDIASVLLAQGNYQPAIEAYIKAIDIIKKGNAPEKWRNIGTCYLSIGVINHDLKQDNIALQNFLDGLNAYKQQTKTELEQAYALMYISGSLLALKRFGEAKEYLYKTQTIADSIRQKAVFMQLYKHWGLYYRRINDYDSAAASFKKAIAITRQTGDKLEEQYNLTQLGNAYKEAKHYLQSTAYYEAALRLARSLGHKSDERDILKSLSGVYSFSGQYADAVKYYRQYVRLADSLNETDVQKKINEIETRYQTRKKEDSILVLRKNAQLQQLELHKKKTVNALLIAGCGVLLLLAALLYTNFKRKNQLLKQSEILQAQRIAELQKEQQLLAMQSVLKGQEAERSRLAKDLHDGVGGLLSGVKLSLSTMKGNVFLSEENAKAVNVVIDQLDQSITELRRVSHNMMPEALIKFGLKEALENYCDSLNMSGKIKVQLQAYGMEQRMEQNTEIVLYRIVQELLNNVIKHADAKNVLVQLIRKNDRFSLTVEDDGKGFDMAANTDGAGLANVRTRAEYLNGTVDIHSSPGEGTSVNVEGDCT